jgi:thioredoxin reductase (NADPH)
LPSETEIQRLRRLCLRDLRRLFYRGKEVLVIGGGNTAVEEALFLTNFASKVTVVHRRDSFRAEKILQDRCSRIQDLGDLGQRAGGRARQREPAQGQGGVAPQPEDRRSQRAAGDGIFIAIGHTPASELFVGQVEMKPSGYIKTAPFSTATSVPGVFAAGDVTDDVYRQAVTAAGQGCMAALEAERFLAAQGEAEPAVAAE